jgi:hypothetical protein
MHSGAYHILENRLRCTSLEDVFGLASGSHVVALHASLRTCVCK